METIDNPTNLPKKQLPNATATLVLGILSIVFSCCYGLIGLIVGIIALAISGNAKKMYEANPSEYQGYENLRAGRIMAIVGIVLSALFILFIIVYVVILGYAFSFAELQEAY